MKEIDIAIEAATAGSEILLKYWQHIDKSDADLKARNDWVSRADRESEKAILERLSDAFPNDRYLGEESGMSAAGEHDGQRTWIVDPLDGTSNYLQHFPMWSISIGLRKGDEIVAGVIYEPLRDLWFTAERGAGAFRNGERIHVAGHDGVRGSFLATGFPFRAQQFVSVYCHIFEDVIRIAKGVRRAGSAALDLAYTAAGIFDGFFELHLAPWDVAAGALLVLEAGGRVSDFSGTDRWLDRGNIVGASPAVHDDLLKMIARHVTEQQLDRRDENRSLNPE